MITLNEWPLLLPTDSSCRQVTSSLSNGPHHGSWHVKVRKACVPPFNSTIVTIKQSLTTPRSSRQCGWSGFLGESSSTREDPRRHELLATRHTTFLCGDAKAVLLKNSISIYSDAIRSWQTTLWPSNHCRARFGDKFKRKMLRKLRKERPNLAERIRRGFEKVGLEREFSQLPQWSQYVPFLAGAAEVVVMVFWAVVLKGDSRSWSTLVFQVEGLITLLLGVNFTVGWLASQISTWRVQALRSAGNGNGAGKTSLAPQAAKPSVVDFAGSFLVNLIPYGNFLAWTRFAWKESSPVSSVNALVYVVPSLVRLVLWTRGLGMFRVQLLAWMLGSVHRPYDAARVKNERVLSASAARARALDEKKAEEELRKGGKSSELTVEEMALLQERRELEEFDMLLSRSTKGGSTTIPGPPQDWSVGDTVQWLAREGFARYSTTFTDNDIDGGVLLLLTADDLRDELGIQSLGDRRKLAQAIQRLK